MLLEPNNPKITINQIKSKYAGGWKAKKAGKRLISHRSTAYPCFLPDLGEFSGSWSYETCPDCKSIKINFKHKYYENDL